VTDESSKFQHPSSREYSNSKLQGRAVGLCWSIIAFQTFAQADHVVHYVTEATEEFDDAGIGGAQATLRAIVKRNFIS
jgi:hypothetical protein